MELISAIGKVIDRLPGFGLESTWVSAIWVSIAFIVALTIMLFLADLARWRKRRRRMKDMVGYARPQRQSQRDIIQGQVRRSSPRSVPGQSGARRVTEGRHPAQRQRSRSQSTPVNRIAGQRDARPSCPPPRVPRQHRQETPYVAQSDTRDPVWASGEGITDEMVQDAEGRFTQDNEPTQ